MKITNLYCILYIIYDPICFFGVKHYYCVCYLIILGTPTHKECVCWGGCDVLLQQAGKWGLLIIITHLHIHTKAHCLCVSILSAFALSIISGRRGWRYDVQDGLCCEHGAVHGSGEGICKNCWVAETS